MRLQCLAYTTGYFIPLDLYEHLVRARLPEERGEGRAREAFLVRIYWPVRRAVSARLQGSPDRVEAAREVTQQVILNVLSQLHTCRASTERGVWAWVWQVTTNARIDYLRAQRPPPGERVAVEDVERDLDLASGRDWRTWAEQQPPSEDPLLLRCLMESYEEMPAETATFIWYHVALGASFNDLAQLFGITRAAARRRWQRARSTLRRLVLARLDRMPPGPERDAARAAIEERGTVRPPQVRAAAGS